jgi:hypothetical protein
VTKKADAILEVTDDILRQSGLSATRSACDSDNQNVFHSLSPFNDTLGVNSCFATQNNS